MASVMLPCTMEERKKDLHALSEAKTLLWGLPCTTVYEGRLRIDWCWDQMICYYMNSSGLSPPHWEGVKTEATPSIRGELPLTSTSASTTLLGREDSLAQKRKAFSQVTLRTKSRKWIFP